MNFTAKDVADLRAKTGCGMMDCKKALTEAEGDVEKATEILREKGLAASVKKASRIAAEGVAYAMVSECGKVGVVIEVNAETDFVAKNDKFVDFVKEVKPAKLLYSGVRHGNSHLDEMIDHLQGGFEGIQLERAAEHTDFNRVRIRKVDRSISPSAGILRVVHLLGRRKTDTVSSRPAVHLGLRAAAEPQQLRPELFDEVKQAGNRGFLLFISTAECQAGDMYMQSAGSCCMAEIAHALRLAKNLRPRHFVQLIFERHRVSD